MYQRDEFLEPATEETAKKLPDVRKGERPIDCCDFWAFLGANTPLASLAQGSDGEHLIRDPLDQKQHNTNNDLIAMPEPLEKSGDRWDGSRACIR
jgi:hypothetical protein